jgi:hypothetical protein
MEPAEKAAHEILDLIEATYQPTHDYVVADPRAFRHLDIAFYDRIARLLASKGYRTVADLEDKTITNAPGVLMPVLLRTLLSRDGTVIAALYHPRIRSLGLRLLIWLLGKRPGKVIDFETEFEDGSFVATSNAKGADGIGVPPQISSAFIPSASLHELHQHHLVRVAAHRAARHDVAPRVMRDLAELIASQNRMNALKAAYRGEVGGVSKEELDRLARPGNRVVGEIHDALVRERERRAS